MRARCRMGRNLSRFGNADTLSANTMGGSHPLRRLWSRHLLPNHLSGMAVVAITMSKCSRFENRLPDCRWCVPVKVKRPPPSRAARLGCSQHSPLLTLSGKRSVSATGQGSKSFVASMVARQVKANGNIGVLTGHYLLEVQSFMKIRAAEGVCGALHSFGLSR
jgi:hypothetical protein